MVQCKIDNETSSPELDAQILSVFKTLTSWTVGTYNGTPVDNIQLESYTVKDGRVILN